MRRYSSDPDDPRAFTQAFDRTYSRFATVYDRVVRVFPVWRNWLDHALPHLVGPRVLEVSFGTGYLLTRYAGLLEAYGIDLNPRMVEIARRNLRDAGLTADLRQGSVESLPFADGTFTTVLSTMAFSGYPDARKALREMLRVLDGSGRIVLIDVNYPSDGNIAGSLMTRLWMSSGDLIRDMGALFREHDLRYSDAEIGGWGSIHLYVATRRADVQQATAPPPSSCGTSRCHH